MPKVKSKPKRHPVYRAKITTKPKPNHNKGFHKDGRLYNKERKIFKIAVGDTPSGTVHHHRGGGGYKKINDWKCYSDPRKLDFNK